MESKIDHLTREDKFQLLDSLVRNGIEELCKFAKQHKYIDPPYGKKPDPTPLISEEDFVKSGALHCDDEEPQFQYDYGFDAVKFLGQYLLWAHPDSVQTRRQRKSDAMDRLRHRVNHARRQIETQKLLQTTVQNYRSGIAWGPLALIVSTTSVRLSLKTFKESIVFLELSADSKFSTDSKYFRLGSSETEQDTFVCKIDVENLKTNHVYHIRVFALSKADIGTNVLSLPNSDHLIWHDIADPSELSEPLIQLSRSVQSALYSTFCTVPIESEGEGAIEEVGFIDEIQSNDHHNSSKKPSSRPVSRSATRDADDASEDVLMRQKLMTLRCIGQLPVETVLLARPALPTSLLSPFQRKQTPNLPVDDIMETSSLPGSVSNDIAGPRDSNIDHYSSHKRIPDVTAVLSDAFWHRDADEFSNQQSTSEYSTQLSSILQRLFFSLAAGCSEHKELQSSVVGNHGNNTSLLWAYRDSHPRAMSALRLEELAFKQHRHDMKKYNKKYDLDQDKSKSKSRPHQKTAVLKTGDLSATAKDIPPPPQLKLPEMTPQFQSLLHQLPIPMSMIPPPPAPTKDEKSKKPPVGKKTQAPMTSVETMKESVPMPLAPRMLYRAVPLCNDVLAIVLDLRRTPQHLVVQGNFAPGCDYLGREQSDWLSRILRKSTAMWKLILCPKTFGATFVNEQQRIEEVATNLSCNSYEDGNYGNFVPSGNGIPTGRRSPTNSRPDTGSAVPSNPTDGFRPSTAGEDGSALTASSSANAIVPGAGGLKRQASVGGSNSQARFVQVQEPEKDDSKALDAVYDDVDEVFGRPKCSLQYVLARYQEKLADDKAKDGVFLPPPLFSETDDGDLLNGPGRVIQQFYVSSGVVLLTGGIATAFTRTLFTQPATGVSPTGSTSSLPLSNMEKSTQLNTATYNNNQNIISTNNKPGSPVASRQAVAADKVVVRVQLSDVQDIDAPTFCASYSTLTSSSTSGAGQQTTLLMRTSSSGNGLSSPSSQKNIRTAEVDSIIAIDSSNDDNKNSISNGVNDVILPAHSLPFCFEVSVGHGLAQSKEGVFKYLPGFDARTVYLQSEADKATQNSTLLSPVSAPQCEVSFLADGRLEISCCSHLPLESADPLLGRFSSEPRVLYSCRLTVPNLAGADDASDQSGDSIHVA